jgi:RNA polymerase sigma factor (sigma-70 family)
VSFAFGPVDFGVLMQFETETVFVDASGQPFDERLQKAIRVLLPRFRRTFSQIRDEAVVADVVEAACNRLMRRERQKGHIAELHGYLWTAMRHEAISHGRRSESRLQCTIERSAAADSSLTDAKAVHCGAEQIEASVLFEQALRLMTPEERQIAIRKIAGFSGDEIAAYLNKSPGAIHVAYSRMRSRIRKLIVGLPEDRADWPEC